MYYVKLSHLLNHYTLKQFIRFAELNPEAMVEVNDGCAESILLEVSEEKDGRRY